MKSFLVDCDHHVAQWAWNTFAFVPAKFDKAIGIVENNELIAAAMFHAHNGFDVEVSYYGPRTMTLGIVRGLAQYAVHELGVTRITARTSRSNKTMTRGIKKIGFEYEGIRHCGYGDQDAVMYGLYGRKLAKLAQKELH